MKPAKKARLELEVKLTEINRSLSQLEIDIQILAYSALEMARQGDLTSANYFIRLLMKDQFWRVELLISWFESHGKLKWSSQKKKLVNNEHGKWNLVAARVSPWYDSKLLLENGEIDYEHGHKQPALESGKSDHKASLNADNFSSVIHQFLKEHPLNDNPIGKFGLPADKDRWDRYKLRIKRK